MPTRLHPAKVATPLDAFLGLVVQLSVPDEGVKRDRGRRGGDHVAAGVFDLDHRLGGEVHAVGRVARRGGEDELSGRPGGHGDVRRGRRREAVTGETERVVVAVHAVEGEAAERRHARGEGARGAARGDGAAGARGDRCGGGARVDRGHHVAAGVLDLDHGLGAEGARPVALVEGSVAMTSWVAAPSPVRRLGSRWPRSGRSRPR